MFLDYLNSQDKQKKEKELPEWFQQSSLGQFAQQQQDKANQWFGDVIGVNPDAGMANPIQQYTAPIQQYGDQLKQQGQQWFMQTPVGQGVNNFYTGLLAPTQNRSQQLQQEYQAKIQNLYNNAG